MARRMKRHEEMKLSKYAVFKNNFESYSFYFGCSKQLNWFAKPRNLMQVRKSYLKKKCSKLSSVGGFMFHVSVDMQC